MLWGGIPLLVAFSSFVVAALTMDKPLTADIIFPALSLFLLLQFPLAVVRARCASSPKLTPPQFSQVISNIIEAIVSLRRLSDFLSADELQLDARKLIESPTLRAEDEVLSIKNADFSWSRDAAQPTLEDITLSVKKGELVGILGRVGCGKVIDAPFSVLLLKYTSLVCSLLSSATCSGGTVNWSSREE